MVFLNVLYGLIMALALTLGVMAATWSLNFEEGFFFIVWSAWSLGHIAYDLVAYKVVRLFNKNEDVYRG